MTYSSELAEIRFGCGLSPILAPATSVDSMLDGLLAADDMATQFPMGSSTQLWAQLIKAKQLRRKSRKSSDKDGFLKQYKAVRRDNIIEGRLWYARSLLRWSYTRHGLRERLAAFWADHFTAVGKNAVLRNASVPYVEEAIRPNMTGRFSDLLIATATHPLMLQYLDQAVSVGPTSQAATKSKRLKGLNENLAREVMELHTLGVGGPYTQEDVRQLAELFTGLSFDRKTGFEFRESFAEPGAETVLGHSYGDQDAALEPILQALRDLAEHPATARHIAQKLAVHFVSDAPDPALVDHVAARFIDTGGDLMAVYAALLEHPASWHSDLSNVKPPADFIGSAARALTPDPDRLQALSSAAIRRNFLHPLTLMGQTWNRPGGPDGWPEEDTSWITPHGVSIRLRWALTGPRVLRPDLPDPRQFVTQALGSYASQEVVFAANAAESRSDAIGLVLAAPAFQRR